MREIKFRAWDEHLKEMVYVFDGNNYVQMSIHSELVIGRYDSNDDYYELDLMQYTGLKDKNDKEIYEGDIVNIKHPQDISGDFSDTNGRVFWWDEEAAFYHGNSNDRPPKRMWEYCEVIGNIYENPELIEE